MDMFAMAKASSKSEKTNNRGAEAPGQALGYSLQYTCLVQMLLEAREGALCGLEYLDDVSENDATGKTRLVQTKSALTANPVANRSRSLWKTLFNWLSFANSDGLALDKVEFEIYVSRPVEGSIVRSFHEANTLDAAKQAILAARKELWGEAPEYKLREQISTDISKYVDAVLDPKQQHLAQIVLAFKLRTAKVSPNKDLEALIGSHPVRKSKVLKIADYICGVVKRKVDYLLEQELPAILNRDEVHAIYAAYCRKIDSDTVLTSYAKKPTQNETQQVMPAVFVQQMDLIGLEFEEKLEAISDFLMASADRTEWAARGEIDASSFDDLDDRLKRSWSNQKKTHNITSQDFSLEQQGELLYRDCLSIKTTLEAKDTPNHFIPGCLHQLANDLSIGWHPKYEELLSTKELA